MASLYVKNSSSPSPDFNDDMVSFRSATPTFFNSVNPTSPAYQSFAPKTTTPTTNTGTPTVQSPSQDQAQSNVRSAEDALRGTINDTYNNIVSQLDQQAGLLPGYEQQDLSTINNTVGNLRTGIQTGLDNANKSIDLTRQQIQTGVDKSVSDIQNNLRSLLKNAQGIIGAYGAGSSSVAQQQLPYAFSKMFAQQRGNIQGQANNQFTDLEKKSLDVQTTFANQKSQIDMWENDQLTSTRDKYRNMLAQINNAKINASGQRAQALQAMQAQILNVAQNELLSIQQEAANTRQAIQQWALQRSGQLQSMQQALSSAGQYDPQAIQYQQLQGLQQGVNSQPSGGGLFDFLPFVGKKDDENQ